MRKTASTLIVIVFALVSLGVVMLASTSSVKGTSTFDDPHYFVKRQLLWLLIACLVGAGLTRFDYHWWKRLALPLLVLSVILLALVLVPGIGRKAGGSYRWLRLGPVSVQPSELAKFAVVIGLAAWMAHVGRGARSLRQGVLVPLAVLGVILGLMILEPDFGTTLLTGVVGMIMLFAAGARVSYLVVAAALGGSAFLLAIMRDPVRMTRILAFLTPEEFPDAAHHLQQSKVAFIRGGWFGVGLGNSIQKHRYLPEAHTDFIFAIIGEELGFLATCLVVALFAGILVCGMVISFRAQDPFGRLVAFGMTMLISLQTVINIGVVTGCLPTKGLPLPFISYGGSSLVASIAAVGVLLNVAGHGEGEHADDHTRSIKDRAHRL
jgi:cell division protein FtsW